MKSLKITIVLPFRSMTGGTKVMVEYANRLHDKGHDVTIVYPWYLHKSRHLLDLVKGPGRGFASWWARAQGKKEITWMPVNVPLKCIRALSDAYLPDADILFATENQTIDPLEQVSYAKGKKVYFIQHYETWSRAASLVDATWKSKKWHKITIATWLKKLAQEKFDSDADLVVNGVDMSVFHDAGKTWNTPPRVLSLYHHLEWKGIPDTVTAMKSLQDKGIAFTPVFFGHIQPSDDVKPLGDIEFHHFPTGETLRKLYAGADIFVSASWAEGCQLPPMEAMACGAALVATNVGGVPDYTIPGKTALVVEPKHPEQLAVALESLLTDPAKTKEIAAAGHAHIQNFTWERATDRLEAILLDLAAGKRENL